MRRFASDVAPSMPQGARRRNSKRRSGSEALLRAGSVSVDVVERRRFVTGLVAKPGAYRFSIGATVIHATALAGSIGQRARTGLKLCAGSRASEEELKRPRKLTPRADATATLRSPSAPARRAAGPERARFIRDEP
jgi:protein involved in polysaccharide export with SLBB domain